MPEHYSTAENRGIVERRGMAGASGHVSGWAPWVSFVEGNPDSSTVPSMRAASVRVGHGSVVASPVGNPPTHPKKAPRKNSENAAKNPSTRPRLEKNTTTNPQKQRRREKIKTFSRSPQPSTKKNK